MISIDRDQQSTQIIDEYLTLSRSLIDKRESNGRIQYGYAVACLVLCAIDAIGHRVLEPRPNKNIRLDILETIIPDEDIKPKTISDISDFFRNGLVHAGLMAKGVFITGSEDKVFTYTNERVSGICLPKLLSFVENYWDTVRYQASRSSMRSDSWQPSMSFSSEAQAASGCVTLTSASSGFIETPRKP